MINYTIIKDLILFQEPNGNEPFTIWLKHLDKEFQRRIKTRVLRLKLGNYGDFRKLNKDIFELRFVFGAGYRVYFAKINTALVLLLCEGDKKTQHHDIERAIRYYNLYKEQEK